jgi:hypothetical protein
MASTGTRNFNLDIGDILEEAYEQAGLPGTKGQDFRSALRSLNLIQLEWSNIGINLWQVEEVVWNSSGLLTDPAGYLVSGQSAYNVAFDTISILGASIRTDQGTVNQIDYNIERISRPEYQAIVNKRILGRPTTFYYNRIDIKDESVSNEDTRGVLRLWQVPDRSSYYQLVYWRMKRMADAGDGPDSTVAVPDRFLPAYIATLASKLALKATIPEVVARGQELEARASTLLMAAMEEDREKSTLTIVPRISRI